MTQFLKQALLHGYQQLQNTSKTPHLDTEVLLASTLNKKKEFLFTHPEYKLSSKEWKIYENSVAERKKHRPIAYITKKKDFFGLSFFIDERVLIPRPETEIIVESILSTLKPLLHAPSNTLPSMQQGLLKSKEKYATPILFLDVGTGGGCIPVSVMHMLQKKERQKITCVGIDIDQNALKVAKKNIGSFQLQETIRLVHGDLLSPTLNNPPKRLKKHLQSTHLILSANLPYLPRSIYEQCPDDVLKFEPSQALLGGDDGLLLYRPLLHQIAQFLKKYPPSTFHAFFEIEPLCANTLIPMSKHLFPQCSVSTKKDLFHQKRFLIISHTFSPPFTNIP